VSIPASTRDLLPSEQRIVADMQQRRFCRYEFISIRGGELVLNPWPATVTAVRFASQDPATATNPAAEFQLKRQMIEFLEYVRTIDSGEIRCLEVRHGLPFSMEVEHCQSANGGERG
jgi:hypothetical protein